MTGDNENPRNANYDAQSSEELIEIAMGRDPDLDEEEFWQPVRILQSRLPKIFERIKELGFADDPKQRELAATLLGQSHLKDKTAPSDCVGILLKMLETERVRATLVSIAYALGHLDPRRAIEPLVRLCRHSEAAVRFAAVCSLCCCESEDAIAALSDCSCDDDRDVRNWATFGLGSLTDRDTPAIRTALFSRLQDTDDEVRGEALVGLARRGDIRVADALLKEFDSLEVEILRDWVLITDAIESVVDAGSKTGCHEWLPVLKRAKALGLGNEATIGEAIRRCLERRQ